MRCPASSVSKLSTSARRARRRCHRPHTPAPAPAARRAPSGGRRRRHGESARRLAVPRSAESRIRPWVSEMRPISIVDVFGPAAEVSHAEDKHHQPCDPDRSRNRRLRHSIGRKTRPGHGSAFASFFGTPTTHGVLRRLLLHWSSRLRRFMNICCPRCGGLAEPAGHEDARAFFQCPTCSRVWATHISASASPTLPASMAPRVLIADDSPRDARTADGLARGRRLRRHRRVGLAAKRSMRPTPTSRTSRSSTSCCRRPTASTSAKC